MKYGLNVLKTARKLIAEQGWATNIFHSARGGYCALGAMRKAYLNNPNNDQHDLALSELLGFSSPEDVAEWNDGDTDSAEVLAHFDARIAALEAVVP